MKLRILTSIVALPLLFVVLIFSRTFMLPLAVALGAIVGVHEMLGCIGVRKYPSVYIPSVMLAGAVAFAARYAITATERNSYVLAIFASIAFIYVFYMLCMTVVSKGKKNLGDMMLTAIMTLYITVGFSSMVLLRDVRSGENDLGAWLLALVFVGAWIPDTAAYFVGKALGKHKLIPDVSPKKTVEGAIGGVVFGGIAYVVTGFIASKAVGFEPHYISLAVAGVVIAIVSIFGDLIASLVKRQYGIKDYGWLFPGHGGVMDRFDSILAIAPFLMIVCSHPDIFALII